MFLVSNTSVGLSSSKINGKIGALIDSGTTLAYFTTALFSAFQTSTQKACRDGVDLPGVCNAKSGKGLFDGYCFPMTPKQISNFPVITLVLSSGRLDFVPASYMVTQTSYFCLGIQDGGDTLILGDTFMQSYFIHFDIAQNKIGFSGQRGNC